jgi:hypothetical protein
MKTFNVGQLAFTVKEGNLKVVFNIETLSSEIVWEVYTKSEDFCPQIEVKGQGLYEIYVPIKDKWLSLINKTELGNESKFKDVLKRNPEADGFIVEPMGNIFAYNNGVARNLIINTKESQQLLFRSWNVEQKKKISNTFKYETRSLSVGEIVKTVESDTKPDTLTGSIVVTVNFIKDTPIEDFFN